MADFRFYGEGLADDKIQMFLSECGIFFRGTRKELVSCYKIMHPQAHTMVYLYSRLEYDKNREVERKEYLRKIDTASKLTNTSMAFVDFNGPAYKEALNKYNDEEWQTTMKREMGFGFNADNGVER